MKKIKEYINYLNCQNHDFSTIREYAKVNDVPIIQENGLNIVKFLIHLKRPEDILEIGTAIGYSALEMLYTRSVEIDTIEKDPLMHKIALENLSKYDLKNKIRAFCADALEIDLTKLKSGYDLIFIDAAKAQYEKFFQKFSPLLKKDGIIITDNVLFHGLGFEDQSKVGRLTEKVMQYNEFLRNNQEFETYFLPDGDGLSISYKR